MKIPRYPDILELVRAELQRTNASGAFVNKATDVETATGVQYDSIVRIRRGAGHDPRYSTVKQLADHLFQKNVPDER